MIEMSGLIQQSQKRSNLSSLALDSSPKALRAGWFSNTEFYKPNRNRHKAGFRLVIKNSPGWMVLLGGIKRVYGCLPQCLRHFAGKPPPSAASRSNLTRLCLVVLVQLLKLLSLQKQGQALLSFGNKKLPRLDSNQQPTG